MLRAFMLLLPALIPSWRFFDGVAPSPRIQYALLNQKDEAAQIWHEFRPRPQHLSFSQMLKRMIWNPRWNENLFLVSCAERLMDYESEHSVQEICKRLTPEISSPYFQCRLVFIFREDQILQQSIRYISPVFPGSAS